MPASKSRVIAKRSSGSAACSHATCPPISGRAETCARHSRFQVSVAEEDVGAEFYREVWKKLVDLGDFIGAEGNTWVTKTGEPTCRATRVTFLAKALRPLPEKWHGLKDPELRLRLRYVDLVMDEETRARFRLRTRTVRTIRAFLEAHGFDEVETPVLQAVPSGAAARPFLTHHNALDLDVCLRIAPETWLKRLIVGGYDRVYEFARCFRNEGMDPSHLQEFTMLEYYVAYWSYEDNMRFTEHLVKHVVEQVLGRTTVRRPAAGGGRWRRSSAGSLWSACCNASGAGIAVTAVQTVCPRARGTACRSGRPPDRPPDAAYLTLIASADSPPLASLP